MKEKTQLTLLEKLAYYFHWSLLSEKPKKYIDYEKSKERKW